MGSNRHMTNSASQPQTTMQTHTPSGSNPCTATTLENSTQIKREPVSDLDLGLSVDCQTESWAESYQDLSSWCNATSACSPATCQSPVTDETFIIGSDFQGLIDFDLRKSEEIASVPVDEVGSFNLWGSEGQQNIPSSVLPSVGAASGTVKNESVVGGTSSEVKAEPVLLHDCWLFEVDREEGLKRASASKQFPAVTSSSTTSTSQHLIEDAPSNNSAVKSESSSVVAAPQQLLPDSVKMAELQRRLERIASHTHPGADSKEKAAELLKILQRQITTLSKKKYNSPAAVADLPHTGFVPQIDAVCSSGSAAEPCYVCPAVTSAPSASNCSDNLFQSDPFDGLFNLPEVQGVQHNYSQNLPSMSTAGQRAFSQNLVTSAAPFVSSNYQLASTTISSQSGTNGRPLVPNVFNEAHQEVLKSVGKVDPPHITNQLNQQQVLEQLPQILMVQMPQHQSHQQESQLQVVQHQQPPHQHSLQQKSSPVQRSFTLALKKEPPPVMKPSGRLGMPELELNFDALLFEQAGLGSGLGRVPEISTPEVLKPLVDVPDAEGFDLLSYVCDDKACTPPVVLEINPFHFPQLNTSQVSVPQITFPDRKQNIMVVKPLHSESRHISNAKMDSKENAVIVQVQPELMPSTFMEDDEEVKEVQHCSEVLENKMETTTARPVRSPRKRKLSDDFIVEPSEIEEVTRPGRRRRIASSRHDSDDEYVLPVRRTRKKTNVIIEDDDDEEDIIVKKRPKTSIVSSPRAARGERTVSTSSESDRYRELRDRNNEASRKSRLTRKAREQELGKQADVLTKENRILKVKVDEMENLVKKLREALLQSMMKKTSN